MAEIIDGKKLAEDIIARIKTETEKLKESGAREPGLAVILVGEDSASQIYVKSKGKKAEECGFHSETIRLDEKAAKEDVLKQIAKLNNDEAIHGILVQLPLPKHLPEAEIVQAISPAKDIDGLNYANIGRMVSGDFSGFLPCTPAGIMRMVRKVRGNDLSGLDAVIVGRSNIVGKPAAALLLAANATTTIAHSRTRELPEVVRSADILVAAVGRPEMIKAHWLKPGATVIDVGINRVPAPAGSKKPTRLVGDVDFAEAKTVAAHITPVPGGVGPMTIAMLMANTLKSACLAAGRPAPDLE